MVTVTAKLADRPVRVEVHGPHDVRAADRESTMVIRVAVRLINQRARVYGGILLGGGMASFEDERIACATLAEVCDEGTVEVDGLDFFVPADADA